MKEVVIVVVAVKVVVVVVVLVVVVVVVVFRSWCGVVGSVSTLQPQCNKTNKNSNQQ